MRRGTRERGRTAQGPGRRRRTWGQSRMPASICEVWLESSSMACGSGGGVKASRLARKRPWRGGGVAQRRQRRTTTSAHKHSDRHDSSPLLSRSTRGRTRPPQAQAAFDVRHSASGVRHSAFSPPSGLSPGRAAHLLSEEDEVGFLALDKLRQDAGDGQGLQRLCVVDHHVHGAVGAHGQRRPQRVLALLRPARHGHHLAQLLGLLQAHRL